MNEQQIQKLFLNLTNIKSLTKSTISTPSSAATVSLTQQDINKLVQTRSNLSRWLQLHNYIQKQEWDAATFKNVLLLSTQTNYLMKIFYGYYQVLLLEQPKYPLNFFNSIEKDVIRTFPPNHSLQQPLRNILKAYAIRNPILLYCQGMNYIVTFLLINNCTEQQAYWLIVALIENILPTDYFRNLNTISITISIFKRVIDSIFPSFAQAIEMLGMDSSLFLIPWFICLFTKGFINTVSQYLITTLILELHHFETSFVLLKIAIAIISSVLNRQNPFTYENNFSIILYKSSDSFRDNLDTVVFDTSLQSIRSNMQLVNLNYKVYLKIYQHYREKEIVQEQAKDIGVIKAQGIVLPQCSELYPICLHRIEIQKKIGEIEEVYLLKDNKDMKKCYIKDYFQYPSSQGKNSVGIQISQQLQDFSSCLILRHHHICCNDGGSLTNKPMIPYNKLSKQPKEQQQQCKNEHKSKQLSSFINLTEGQLQFSVQDDDRFTNIEDKFMELKEYFTVDDKEQEHEHEGQRQLAILAERLKDHSREENINSSTHDKTSKIITFLQEVVSKLWKRNNILQK